jgi:pyrroline-5-carboxylate reductase
MRNQLKIGIIGMGRMGQCLANGLVEVKKIAREQILFTTKHSQTNVKNNSDLVKQSDIVILSVKPQSVAEVLEEIKGSVTKDKLILSIAASITTADIEKKLGKGVAVIRAMPNTPVQVKAGVTAFSTGQNATKDHVDQVKWLFESLGKVVQVDEKHMDAVTGLSGCGPAYVYVILESLTDAGIKVGLPRELALELASQTVLGAAKMLQDTGRHPASLKDEVTTPAGCTIDGLLELEEGKLRVTLVKAVVQATKRAKELAT